MITLDNKRTVVAEGFRFTESPRWHEGRLYFPDINSCRVHSLDDAGRVDTVAQFDVGCSGIGFLPGGDLLVVLKNNTLVRVSGGRIHPYADLKRFADTTINDMVVTATGRAYVTQLGPPKPVGGMPQSTRIVAVEPGGEARVAVEGLRGPNGIAISADGKTLVVCESGASRLVAFDVDAAGELSNQRTFGQLPEGEYPDGMCLDDQGGAWTGVVIKMGVPRVPGPGFLRFDGEGRATHLLPLEPGRHAVACVFGGQDRRTLYLATAGAVGMGEDGPFVANIESVRIDGFGGAGIP